MGEKAVDNFEYVPANQCFVGESTTPFGLEYDMDQMKDMVRDADPETVRSVAKGWEALQQDLVGADGIKAALDSAVEHVLAHWEGQSADLFRERARVVSQKITDSAKYAEYTSKSLAGAAETLADIQPKVLAMQKPSGLDSKVDWIGDLGDRDASGADSDLGNGASSGDVLSKHEGSLSAGREAQLAMAEQMEILGAAYNRRALEMGSWNANKKKDDSEDYPGDPGGIPPAAVAVTTGAAPRSPQSVPAGTSGVGKVGAISSSKTVNPPASITGITGGAHKPSAPQPQVGTAIDGVSGRAGGATANGPSVSGGTSNNGVPAGTGAVPMGGAPGVSAGPGSARGSVAGRANAGARSGSVGGRGAVGASAAPGSAKGGPARAGGLARQSGGVVGGTPRSGAGAGGTGRGTAGGAGLHRSRGAEAGASAIRAGGAAGVPSGRTGRSKDQERRESERPDYLVEDEETWTPQSNAAPRVIE